jgi:TP901 family phage tail tape measure protein
VLGAGLAIMGAGAATLAGAFGLAQQAAHFEQEVARVGAIARASTEDMQRLHDAAIQAGIATQFTPTEAIEGLGVLAQQGFNTSQSIQLLTPTLDLAAGGMISVESAAEAVTNATHVFNLSMDEAANSANQLLRISNLTALSAGELGLAMGTVARGSRQTHQSISEMLPAIGLLRNTGLDASTSAQSVSSALIFMSQRAEAIHQSLGVDLVETLADGTQQFRPFMDIAMEAGEALETRFANPAERTAEATRLFSRFGVGAVTGVFDSLRRGLTDSEGNLHRGAEAITYLRDQLQNASGAAEEFRNRLLDTFQGQMTLLRGSTETLGIVVGEGFTRAFRPLIEGAIVIINQLITFIQGIPVGVRGAIGQAIIIFGGLLTALGAFLAAGAAIAIIVPFLKAIAIAVGGLLLAMAPLVIAFIALGAAIYVVHRLAQSNAAVARNLARAWDMVRLTFLGLSQAVTEGGFSGAVMDELNRAENSGLKTFILRIAGIGFRIVQFFRGIGIGFGTAIDRMGPTLERMMSAFERLGSALGFMGTEGAGAIAAMPSEKFAATGARIGTFLGNVVETMVKVLTTLAEVGAGVVSGWQKVMGFMGPAFAALGPSLEFLGEQLSEIGISLGFMTEEQQDNASGWQTFGRILGGAVAGGIGIVVGILDAVVVTLGVIAAAINFTIRAFRFLYTTGQLIGYGLVRAFGTVSDTIMSMVDDVIIGQSMIASAIPEQFRPSALNAVIEAGDEARARISVREQDAQLRNRVLDDLSTQAQMGPAVAEANARSDANATNAAALENVSRMIQQQKEERAQTIILQVDSETIATATANGQRRDRAAAFQPVGAEG